MDASALFPILEHSDSPILEHSDSETSSPPMDWELIVVGGGAAGLSAARAGARNGKRTVLVSEGRSAGTARSPGACRPRH